MRVRLSLMYVLFFFLLAMWKSAHADPLRVAVLDTGLDMKDPRFTSVLCKTGHKAYGTAQSLSDTNGHGTHIAGTIKQYAGNSDYCLVIYKVFPDHDYTLASKDIIDAINDAVKAKVDIINLSFGGPDYNEVERQAIYTGATTIFVVAAGNNGENLSYGRFYPASYALANMLVVGATDRDGNRLRVSNYGGPVKYWELGTVISTLPNNYQGLMVGTSMATAVKTGKLIKEMPHATRSH